MVPDSLMLAIHDVLEGLFEAECFLHRVVYYLQGYALGSIGVNKSMRAMSESSRTCWDFKNLINTPPQQSGTNVLSLMCTTS